MLVFDRATRYGSSYLSMTTAGVWFAIVRTRLKNQFWREDSKNDVSLNCRVSSRNRNDKMDEQAAIRYRPDTSRWTGVCRRYVGCQDRADAAPAAAAALPRHFTPGLTSIHIFKCIFDKLLLERVFVIFHDNHSPWWQRRLSK